MLLLLSFVLTLAVTSGCSNVAMPKNDLAVVHARTMDLGSWTDFEFITYPPTESTLGYLGVFPTSRHFDSIGIRHGIAAGMNTEGLSCDMQTLLKTSYPPKPGEDDDREGVMVGFFCDWVLKAFSTVDEVSSALDVGGTHSVYGPNEFAQHFSLRDATGSSIVVEFMDESTQVWVDKNNGKPSHPGIMTNEPVYDWHVENIKHYEWKKGLALPSIPTPGSFYPEERFLRLHSLKTGLEAPYSYRDLITKATALLNAVTIPIGNQFGTDSGEGEGNGDHTVWGMIYDHTNLSVYFRSYKNMSLQRVRLKEDLDLDNVETKKRFLNVAEEEVDWFIDVSKHFKRHP
jgi:penicillin V acylase-like amidase (Ntn superfamily)